MGIYKGILSAEKAFFDKETKTILKDYKNITYNGKYVHEMLGYKKFEHLMGYSASTGRTAAYNKTILKQLDFLLTLMKKEKEVSPVFTTCFRYERELIAQAHNDVKVMEMRQYPVDPEELKKLQAAMKEYEPALKIYESENGISIAYNGYTESSEESLEENEELFEFVKRVFWFSQRTDIAEIISGMPELKKHAEKICTRYKQKSGN